MAENNSETPLEAALKPPPNLDIVKLLSEHMELPGSQSLAYLKLMIEADKKISLEVRGVQKAANVSSIG